MMKRMGRFRGKFAVICGLLAACGKMTGGSSSSRSNDAFPAGATVKSQGNFTAVGDTEISGSAFVLQAQDGSIILRLESLSVQGSVSGLRVALNASGTEVYSASLRSATGNQNYTTGVSAGLIWTTVDIKDSRLTPPADVKARALLTVP